MQLEIRFVSTPSSVPLAEHVKKHVGHSLARFHSRIRRLVIRFEDLNGPRGGLDKVCRIAVRDDFGERIVETRGDDPYAVSARALGLISRSVARAVRWQRASLAPLPSRVR